MEEFFEKTNKGLSENELKGFEGKINFNLPAEYRNFLKITNGATLKKNYLRLSDSRDDLIVSLDDIDSLIVIMRQIRPRQNMKDKIYIQYQEFLLPIGGTAMGNEIFLGIKDIFLGRIFIDWVGDIFDEGEKGIIPIYEISSSFISFLELLVDNPNV